MGPWVGIIISSYWRSYIFSNIDVLFYFVSCLCLFEGSRCETDCAAHPCDHDLCRTLVDTSSCLPTTEVVSAKDTTWELLTNSDEAALSTKSKAIPLEQQEVVEQEYTTDSLINVTTTIYDITKTNQVTTNSNYSPRRSFRADLRIVQDETTIKDDSYTQSFDTEDATTNKETTAAVTNTYHTVDDIDVIIVNQELSSTSSTETTNKPLESVDMEYYTTTATDLPSSERADATPTQQIILLEDTETSTTSETTIHNRFVSELVESSTSVNGYTTPSISSTVEDPKLTAQKEHLSESPSTNMLLLSMLENASTELPQSTTTILNSESDSRPVEPLENSTTINSHDLTSAIFDGSLRTNNAQTSDSTDNTDHLMTVEQTIDNLDTDEGTTKGNTHMDALSTDKMRNPTVLPPMTQQTKKYLNRNRRIFYVKPKETTTADRLHDGNLTTHGNTEESTDDVSRIGITK